MLRHLARRLEHPLHPLLGPNVRALTTMGLWRPGPRRAHRLHDAVSCLCVAFVCTQYAELLLIWGELPRVMDNLSVTTVSTMGILKLATFRLWHARWNRIILAVSRMELSQRRNRRDEDRRVAGRYVLHSRVVTYFFWTVVFLTINMVMLNPVLMYASSPLLRESLRNESVPYPQIFSAWLPFEAARPPRYWFTVGLHALAGYYATGAFAAWDTSVVSVMVFFGGQLELLRLACGRVMGDADEGAVSDAEAHRRLVACHRHHVFLLKYSKLFNSVVSPVMFVYFVICSVMLCAIALQITTQVSSALQLFWTLEFLLATLIQLFLFYWHSNEVLFKILKSAYSYFALLRARQQQA